MLITQRSLCVLMVMKISSLFLETLLNKEIISIRKKSMKIFINGQRHILDLMLRYFINGPQWIICQLIMFPLLATYDQEHQLCILLLPFPNGGLANGIAGALLIKDLIIGDFNKYHHLVDARRWDIKSVGKETLKETAYSGKHFIGDKLEDSTATMSHKSLIPGEGRIIRDGLRVVGAYKDESGKVYAVKPICTHLGCNLSFNDGDRTWDCPCHGSQFDIEGRIIQGPAVTPLEKIDDLSW